MKIICTTSNNYLHILPLFCYLFNKYWGAKVQIVGYDKPSFDLPSNITFHSMGIQGSKKEFSNDLAKYFEKQDEWFIWVMEDTFIKAPVDINKLRVLAQLRNHNVGRINLTGECIKQDHKLHSIISGYEIYENTQTAKYRLSTQPSIWNKKFLLKYMTPGLSPWDFETQNAINDGYKILGMSEGAINHNEGVRRFDLYKYDLTGIDAEDIEHIKTLK